MKKWVKALLCAVLAVVLLIGGYVAYVFIDYHRLGDMELTPLHTPDADAAVQTGQPYTVISYNIGFGAYEPDYGFFMDGGAESRAWSRERVTANVQNIASFLKERQADFYLLQEVDIGSTRTYQLDEREALYAALFDKCSVFAQNYDSPYLMYPLNSPHGASRSGLLTFSRADITAAERVELPVESGFMKLLDLDRCYSVSRIPVESGRELVLYDLHLSAYTSDGSIATEQLELLLASSAYFGEADQDYSWAQPIPDEAFDGVDITLIAPLDESDPVPSCRNADGPYHPGQYVLTVDGFLVSANVEVREAQVIGTGFAYSDHEPVEMTFVLK